MATNKQCKMLLAKSHAAGVKASWEDFEKMENGEIDLMVQELDEKAKSLKPEQKKDAAPETKELNGARFGMVYKIVLESVGHQWKHENPDRFVKEVVIEYNLATKAEAAVSASSSQIYLTDEDRARQIQTEMSPPSRMVTDDIRRR